MEEYLHLLNELRSGDRRALARSISLVENELKGYSELLEALDFSSKVPVVGITGPPGAGKSTFINALVGEMTKGGKQVGVIAIDPTSPFNYGSLLGDRIRMAEHFTSDKVFIRSLATRGSLGGLSAKTIEIVDVMRSAGFDYILIETVGVGQSEVEVAGLADTTILVLVPEAGDEVQTIKSGIMEIGDIFVVNKSDREGADLFARNMEAMVHERIHGEWRPPVIKTVASQGIGAKAVLEAIEKHGPYSQNNKRVFLLAEKAWQLIQQKRMKDLSKQELKEKISSELSKGGFNLYKFIRKY